MSAIGTETTDSLQAIEAYSSSSEDMDRRRPPYKPRNLEETTFGDKVPLSAPSAGGSDPTPGSSSAAEAPLSTPVVSPRSEVQQRSAKKNEGDRPGKRARLEGPSKEARRHSVEDARERLMVEGSEERGPGSALGSWLIGPHPTFRPDLQLEPSRPLNVEDWFAGSSAVIATLCRACALPKDMKRHNAAENAKLLLASLQHSLAVSLILL